jgi:hypothetical protein
MPPDVGIRDMALTTMPHRCAGEADIFAMDLERLWAGLADHDTFHAIVPAGARYQPGSS